MRKSDERQKREYVERSKEESYRDYEERRKAREKRHREADERERLSRRVRRQHPVTGGNSTPRVGPTRCFK